MSAPLPRARSLFKKGLGCLSSGKSREAEACFRQALSLEPDFSEAHANLGLLLDEAGRHPEAEFHYLRSLSLDPGLGKTHMNVGVLYTLQKRFDEAEGAYRHALELMPDSSAAWMNLGVLQVCRKREKEAEQSLRKALELDTDNRRARFNLGYLLLRQGRYEEGWHCLEARTWYERLEELIPCPRWRGEPLEGRSLLIGFEAGHGDMIQFCRYASVLKDRGAARITVMCHPALERLFRTMDGVDEVYPFPESFGPPEWDYWTPPLSMPYHCRTTIDTIPARLPYLRAEKGLVHAWSPEVSEACLDSDIRVGLVWKGNPRFENDDERSLPSLETLERLGSIPGIRFFSLQKGAGEDEAADPPHGLQLVNLGPRAKDFADTAAIVESLDLVISVDTAVAHLAGAMGKACWVLLPWYKTDWRWLDAGTDSPWYPGVMRLFRQPGMGGWHTVVERVRHALEALASTRSRERRAAGTPVNGHGSRETHRPVV